MLLNILMLGYVWYVVGNEQDTVRIFNIFYRLIFNDSKLSQFSKPLRKISS